LSEGRGASPSTGNGSLIHDNLFRGKQTVTNHYALNLDADNAKVYNNRFEPIRGSGISILSHKFNEMYNNVFKITAAPPNNEYSTTDYSTNAIRITDYGRSKGDPSGRWCEGNKIYGNKFYITSKAYEDAHKNYKAVATATFFSVGGGPNEVYDNTVVVDNQSPGKKGNEAWAFYVGGSNHGGNFYRNTVTSNVPSVWISSRYGQGKNVKMYDNAFIKAKDAETFVPIECGYYKYPSENVGFYSNHFVGLDFGVKIGDYTTKSSQYEAGWTLTVNASSSAVVKVIDGNGNEVASEKAGSDRQVVFQFPEYRVKGSEKTPCSDYTVKIGNYEKKITLKSDMQVTYLKEPPRPGSGKKGMQVTKIIGYTAIPYSNVHERCMLDVFRSALLDRLGGGT